MQQDLVEITTHIGPYDIYSLTIVGGKVVRVTCIMSGSACCHVLKDELDSLSHLITRNGKRKLMIWDGARCEIRKYSKADFQILVEDAIVQTGYHNVSRLKDVYNALKPGVERDFCRGVQKHIQDILDW